MAENFDNNVYCEFPEAVAKAGKDILLCLFTSDGTKLLAIAGQQSLTINRSADTVETTSKDTKGGWKSQMAGMKEWSIDSDGAYVMCAESHKELQKYFESGDLMCIKIVDIKESKPLFGGLAVLTEYTLEAPYDDAMTYSCSIAGNGALVDLTSLSEEDKKKVTAMPA
jgi:TP901-1 family phage major tail protein|nr:MAG TPA_asm: major tail protein [Caudoviricetes sp.]